MEVVGRRCEFPECPTSNEGDIVLKTCSRCKKARYCSLSCQKCHWQSHKPSCASSEEKKQPEKKLRSTLEAIQSREIQTLLENHYGGIVRSVDPENPMRAFAKELFPILQLADDWSSVGELEALFVAEARGYFVESLEKYRARHQPPKLSLPSSALGMIHLLKHNTNPADLLLVLTSCIEKLSQGNLTSQWTVEFFQLGMPHQLLAILPGKSSAIQHKICQIVDTLFSQANGLETDIELGVFIMQVVDEFQEKLGGLCRMGIDDMRKHQNAQLSAFRHFLEVKMPSIRLPAIVVRFKLLALQALHTEDHKGFRKLILVSELVRQALEMGCSKLFSTLETIGFRLFLEMVEKVVAAHSLLYRLMLAAKLGPFR